jgi:hypothetical protein
LKSIQKFVKKYLFKKEKLLTWKNKEKLTSSNWLKERINILNHLEKMRGTDNLINQVNNKNHQEQCQSGSSNLWCLDKQCKLRTQIKHQTVEQAVLMLFKIFLSQ